MTSKTARNTHQAIFKCPKPVPARTATSRRPTLAERQRAEGACDRRARRAALTRQPRPLDRTYNAQHMDHSENH
eukprot:6178899-Pleurochrysis_carterae.AAC.1